MQQHQIISSDLHSIALIVSRQGMLPSRRFLMNVLQGEAAALDALHAFADALGLDVSDLEVLEPLQSCSSGSLTTVAHKPSIVIEQATSSYSFRFSELSQPI